jgi:copper/silver efflux system protein
MNPFDKILYFFLKQKLVTGLLLAAIILGGVAVAPFDWDLARLPAGTRSRGCHPESGRKPANRVYGMARTLPTGCRGSSHLPADRRLAGRARRTRSPQHVHVRCIFYFSDLRRTHRILLVARPRHRKTQQPSRGLLPADANPSLGPDATALGQVFWYTLEGRDPDGNTTGGWDLHELRSIQDWTVRYALLASEGISEVASIGGYVREYQIDINPDALRAHNVTLQQVVEAIRKSNLDTGARVTEINRVEYRRARTSVSCAILRTWNWQRCAPALTALRSGCAMWPMSDFGPAQRRGALTRMGAEAVGGVVVVREGYNPLQAIHNVKAKIQEIRPGLPPGLLSTGMPLPLKR